MKNVRVKILLAAFLVYCAVVSAQVPEPVLRVGFQDLFAQVNSGAGTTYQQGSVFSYDNGGTLIEPVLTADQLFSYTYQQNGAIGTLGGGITYQGPELASVLNGLEQFTVICVFSPQSYGHSGASMLFSFENVQGGHAMAMLIDQWNRLALCVNDRWEETAAYVLNDEELNTERHPACWEANVNKWSFAAVTYNGTIDAQTADPYLDAYQNVRHYIAQNATTGATAAENKGAIDPLNNPCLYAGSVTDVLRLWVGNCADTSQRLIVSGENQGLFLADAAYSAAYPAKIKDLLIYDTILTASEINSIKESLTTAGCGGDGRPYPKGDVNFDCTVDIADLQFVSQNWLSSIDIVNW